MTSNNGHNENCPLQEWAGSQEPFDCFFKFDAEKQILFSSETGPEKIRTLYVNLQRSG